MRIIKIRVGKVKPSSWYLEELEKKLKDALKFKGYDAPISVVNSTALNVGVITLTDAFIEKFGKNIQESTLGKSRRTKHLNYYQYVVVNKTINKVLDEMNVSADVKSWHDKLIIRKGKTSYSADDWEEFEYADVGSMMHPILWCDQNMNEKEYGLEEFENFEAN